MSSSQPISVFHTDAQHELHNSAVDHSTEPIQLPPTDGWRQARLVAVACCILQLPVWGFVMSYGVFQAYYTDLDSPLRLKGSTSTFGTIGTTLNGIIYMSMPVLFGLLARRLSHFRMHALALGALLSITSIVASAFVNTVSGLVATQGVLQAFGSTLLYSASTVFLDEWWIQRKGFAYGLILSSKSAVGVALPLIMSTLLRKLGLRRTLLIWAGILAATILPAVFLLKPRIIPQSTNNQSDRRYRRTSWSFLKHRTFPLFTIANAVFATSYGIPQTYLSAFASSALHFTATEAALMLVALNFPSIPASYWFGTMGDGEASKLLGNRRLSIRSVTVISALGSALPIFLLWGMTPSTPHAIGVALITLFSMVYGFFAGGYSATWGGVLKEMMNEAHAHDELVDTGLVMGLINGSRGLGFILGGLLSVELLKVGGVESSGLAYGGRFGGLIVFSGCGAAVSGLAVLVNRKSA